MIINYYNIVTVSNHDWYSLPALFLLNKGHMFIVSSILSVSISEYHACSSRNLHCSCSSSESPNISLSLWNAGLSPLPVRPTNEVLGDGVLAYCHKQLLTCRGPGQTGRLIVSRSQESEWCCKYRMRQNVNESFGLSGLMLFTLQMEMNQTDSPHRQSFPATGLNLNISCRRSLAQNVRPFWCKNCWENLNVKFFSRSWMTESLSGKWSTWQIRFATSISVRRTWRCRNLLPMESFKVGHVSGERKPCLIFLTIGTCSNFKKCSSSAKVVSLHKYSSISSCVRLAQ